MTLTIELDLDRVKVNQQVILLNSQQISSGHTERLANAHNQTTST